MKLAKDTIVYSNESDYAANIEKAEVVYTANPKNTEVAELKR